MYQQKMCYIDLYKNGLKCGNMGHVKLEWDAEKYRFQTNLCRMDRQTLVSLFMERSKAEQSEKIHDVEIIHGKGFYQSDWIPIWGDEKRFLFEASGGVYGVCMLPDMGKHGKEQKENAFAEKKDKSVGTKEVTEKSKDKPAGTKEVPEKSKDKSPVTDALPVKKSDERAHERSSGSSAAAEKKAEHTVQKRDMLEEIRKEKEALAASPLLDNKWDQLCSMYEKAHPVDADIEFIKIKPEDFVILRQEYQGLVKNSFLLHGYYNYHYILLGKYPDKYYLGVPGIMHEQERMAAAMFGFIGFERAARGVGTEGEEANPDFGYYMMEVAI